MKPSIDLPGLIALFFASIFLFTSCQTESTAYTKFTDITKIWNRGDSYIVTIDNKDTISLRQINIAIRRNRHAVQQPLFTIETISPSGIKAKDTINISFSPSERRSNMSYTEFSQPYRSKSRLSESGPYRFIFTILEPEDIDNIVAIGIDIQKKQ